jgi:hypothetical protein
MVEEGLTSNTRLEREFELSISSINSISWLLIIGIYVCKPAYPPSTGGFEI